MRFTNPGWTRSHGRLNLLVLLAFLVSGIALAPAHAHHGTLDRDHACSMCQLAAAPLDLSGSGGYGGALIGLSEGVLLAPAPEPERRAEQPAHSSHPLRGPPSC